jgi:predicted ATPase with chaperone activity
MADIHAKMMASLKREQVGTKVEQYDDSKVKNYWRRVRKPTVDLMELPVAVDRQLEDQRIQQEYNRNPRVHIPTKVDKVRSEQIIAKKGSSRDVGIKAKVVNKFVREASGIHNYALVAPPRRKGEVIPMDHDP